MSSQKMNNSEKDDGEEMQAAYQAATAIGHKD